VVKISPIETCRIPHNLGTSHTKTELSSGHFLADPTQLQNAVRSSPTDLAEPFHYSELRYRPNKGPRQEHSCTRNSGCPDQTTSCRNGTSPHPSNTSAGTDPIGSRRSQ